VLQQDGRVPAADSVERVGSPLVLHRGEATDITVVNELREPTGVHWHGIELESYSDGVVGWSGNTGHMAPMIAPHDSFVAHLTLPRAGTFIYHTHLNDLEQITSGLYGGIIVLEPGARFDPRHDHLYVAGWDGPDDPPHVLVNGDTVAASIEMSTRETHRIRLINIGVAVLDKFVLRRDTTVASWRAIAKDGMTLPSRLATARPAQQLVAVGETYDFEISHLPPGSYRFAVERKNGTVAWQQPINVH
jgi:FtsP/CotA-like multicopper oxidase with cupredoxin domain